MGLERSSKQHCNGLSNGLPEAQKEAIKAFTGAGVWYTVFRGYLS